MTCKDYQLCEMGGCENCCGESHVRAVLAKAGIHCVSNDAISAFFSFLGNEDPSEADIILGWEFFSNPEGD